MCLCVCVCVCVCVSCSCVLGSVYLQMRELKCHEVRVGRNDISLVTGTQGRPKLVSNALSSLRLWNASTRTVFPELCSPRMMMATCLEMDKKNESKP